MVFLIALIFGSFLNCLIWRLRQRENIWGRSYCPNCRKQINWYDNIPLFSYLILKAKCRYCKKNISWQYPAVELATGLLLSFSFFKAFNLPLDYSFVDFIFNIGLSISTNNFLFVLRDWIFICSLIIIFVYDARWQEVPMLLLWPATILVFILSLFLGLSFWPLIIAMAIGSFFFLFQYIVTRKKGVGEGDIWIALFIGTYLANWQILLLALFITYLIGSIFALFLIWRRKKGFKSRLALGPFLVIGTLIALFFGETILSWYLCLGAYC